MKIEQVRAVVTGAASGLGYRFALELARSGAAVVGGDVDAAGLQGLQAAAAGLPGRLAALPLDVAQEDSVRGFVADAGARLGGAPNVLVNNAGVLLDGLLLRPEAGWTRKLPAAQWRRVLEVNLTGAFLVAREVAGAMVEAGTGGVIVNVSSLTRAGHPGQSAYAASKAGLDAATRTWALELAPYGIRVASIAPGLVETPILDNVSDEAKEVLLGRIPLGRFGTPEEIWLALRFAIECDYFNGRTLEVDGGAVV